MFFCSAWCRPSRPGPADYAPGAPDLKPGRPLSIAVCGAGPAGLAAALLLHRDGHRVQLFERFETPQPVGSGLLLQPTGLAVLQQLGLAEPLLARGARITRLHGVARGGRTALDVRYDAMGEGWCAVGVHRAALFAVLHGAVQRAGVPMASGVTIGRADPRLASFDLVVDAMGSQSALSRWQGRRRVLEYGALWVNIDWPGDTFAADHLAQRYLGATTMAGLMPIGWVDAPARRQAAFFWSLRRRDLPAWRGAPLSSWVEQVARVWPEMEAPLRGQEEHAACTFATYDHFTRRVPHAGNCVQIGDAAHATSPQLGQGANMALLDALALATALRASTDLATALPHYAHMRRWHVRLFQVASAVFTPFYQSDSRVLPVLRDQLLAPLTRVPPFDRFVARLVAGMTLAPLRGQSLEIRAIR